MLYATMAATSRNTNLLDIYVSLLGIYMRRGPNTGVLNEVELMTIER